MKLFLLTLALLPLALAAADRPTEPLRLWSGPAPGALGEADKDIPTLTPFWPDADQATGAAMIVFPGGGYRNLAPHEGAPFAKWLNSHGIAAFVLKYRLNPDGYKVPTIFLDAARAIRTVRTRAADWQLDPQRIGVIGSSAGGHLAAMTVTQFDAGRPDATDEIERASSRPDLAILCYAFILFDEPNADREARFLGPDGTPEQKRFLSPRLNVRRDTPPCFIWQTGEDDKVPAENAFAFATALRENKIPFDLHIYKEGKHGIGIGDKNGDPAKLHPWTRDAAFWLAQHGFGK
jgi:acetyl esterase/lipase